MIRAIVATGVLLLSVGVVVAQQDIAVQQDNLMRGQAKSLYGVLWKMSKGDIPYKQASVDAALVELEASVGKIATVFGPNPKEDVVDSHYGASQKVWQNKADFESKIPPVAKAITDAKGKVKDVDSLKVAYDMINDRCTGCHETYRVKLK